MLIKVKHFASRTVLALIVLHITLIIPHVTAVETNGQAHGTPVEVFNRTATYDVPGLVAEIVAATPDSELLIYTDSAAQAVGFVTITDPKHPTSAGSLAMPGEPTSVAVTPDGAWALVAVHAASQNVLVVVDLTTGTIVRHWSAGTTTHAADTVADGDIQLVHQLVDARREPDAITWTPGGRLVTANEGDYDVDLGAGEFVGGRDFTIFSDTGAVLFEPGAALDREAVRHGHYPDERSAAKGIEPEGVAVAIYHDRTFLFVGAERGNFVAVYHLNQST